MSFKGNVYDLLVVSFISQIILFITDFLVICDAHEDRAFFYDNSIKESVRDGPIRERYDAASVDQAFDQVRDAMLPYLIKFIEQGMHRHSITLAHYHAITP